jgi:serine/threonine protein phosphatase PrpC
MYVSYSLEFYEHELVEEDKFMILASDGVWEFISNEDVKTLNY